MTERGKKRQWAVTPEEIEQRRLDEDWMRFNRFPDKLRDSIMHNDQPIMEVVRRMAERYGVDDAKRRLTRFLFEETE